MRRTRRQSLATDWMDAIPTMLAVGIGGIIGANLRWQIGEWATDRWTTPFPWGTLLINLTGSFILGFGNMRRLARPVRARDPLKSVCGGRRENPLADPSTAQRPGHNARLGQGASPDFAGRGLPRELGSNGPDKSSERTSVSRAATSMSFGHEGADTEVRGYRAGERRSWRGCAPGHSGFRLRINPIVWFGRGEGESGVPGGPVEAPPSGTAAEIWDAGLVGPASEPHVPEERSCRDQHEPAFGYCTPLHGVAGRVHRGRFGLQVECPGRHRRDRRGARRSLGDQSGRLDRAARCGDIGRGGVSVLVASTGVTPSEQ